LPFAHILWLRGFTTFSPDAAQENRSRVLSVTINRFFILKSSSKNSFLF